MTAAEFKYLTGELDGTGKPPAIGQKFTSGGEPLRFAGNTVLCRIDQASDAYTALFAAQQVLKAGPCADAFTFLPPASFHMTVFEGVNEQHRMADRWPEHLATDVPLAATTLDFEIRLRDVALPNRFQIRPTGLFGGFSVRVGGASGVTAAALRAARNDLSTALNLRRPDHGTYEFHITLGYLLRWLTAAEADQVIRLSGQVAIDLIARQPKFDIGPVEFCTFETMQRFDPMMLLG
jgi:hypothetical protein